MALQAIKRKSLPIGVDLGSSRVKLAQLRQVGEETELLAAGAAEVPPPDGDHATKRLASLSDAIRAILRSNPFRGRQCVVALPAGETFVHHVKLPRLSPERTRQALRGELQGKCPYPASEAIIREVVAGDVQGEAEPMQEIIVVAASRTTVNAYLTMARRAKLDVVGINIEPFAIVECFSRLFRRAADMARTDLFVDLGTCTTQVVLAQGRRIVFARNLATGGRHFDRTVAEGLGVSEAQADAMRRELRKLGNSEPAADELYHLLDGPLDALADELTQCLRYYESVFRNQPVERAIFVGGQAYDKRLCQALAQRLNLPAQVGDPLVRVSRAAGAGLETGLDRRRPQPDWAVAVGLSLGAERAA